MKTLGVMPKKYPVNLLTKIIFLVFLGITASGILLYFTSHVWLGLTYTEGLRTIATYKKLLIKKTIFIYLITSVFILAGIVVLTVLYSHRVAGPLYRLSLSSRQIASGDLTLKVKLRERDAIHPLADSFNELTESYRARILHIKDSIAELKRASDVLDRAVETDIAEELQKAIDELSHRVRKLKEDMKEIKL